MAETITLGCRLNFAESEAMRTLAGEDTIIVNSCAVTNEAVRQTRQAIRRAHREAEVGLGRDNTQRARRLCGRVLLYGRYVAEGGHYENEDHIEGGQGEKRTNVRLRQPVARAACYFRSKQSSDNSAQQHCGHRATRAGSGHTLNSGKTVLLYEGEAGTD